VDVLGRVGVHSKTEMEGAECSVGCVKMLKDLNLVVVEEKAILRQRALRNVSVFCLHGNQGSTWEDLS
jgi:hypothetical protein